MTWRYLLVLGVIVSGVTSSALWPWTQWAMYGVVAMLSFHIGNWGRDED